MTTYIELAKRLIPDEPDEVLHFVLWNHTAFPLGGLDAVARHLKQWKSLRDAGLSGCALCGKAYKSESGKIVLGGECGECWPPKG